MFPHPFMEASGMWPYPVRVAHRGGGTLAPENTVAGLRCGLAHGFHAVEFDVMLARDGVGVVIHDPELGRTVAGSGKVAEIDSADLVRMDAGSWFGPQFKGEPVPLFTQFVDFCQASGIWMNVEIKPAEGFEAATGTVVGQLVRARFGDAIAAGDWARVPLLSSFSPEALAAARDAAPDVPRGMLVDVVPADWQARAEALGAIAVHTNHKHLSAQTAGAIRAAGFGLFCYTVNDPARAEAILGWGVNGFCTDRIDLIAP
jgi:glycerophosphoryl diester phosphodiesterase